MVVSLDLERKLAHLSRQFLQGSVQVAHMLDRACQGCLQLHMSRDPLPVGLCVDAQETKRVQLQNEAGGLLAIETVQW